MKNITHRKEGSFTGLVQLITALALFGITVSCKKVAGPAGPQGATGNANVQEVTFTNQAFSYNSTYTEYEMHLSVPAITQQVQNTGAIMVYMQPITHPTISIALPYTDQGGITMGYTTSNGGIDLFANYNPDVATYKIVVIPSN